jgi:hypothetical protein
MHFCKGPISAIVLLSSAALVFAAQSPEPARRDTPPASTRFRYDLGYLSSHVLEGRRAGTRASDEAADFIARRFERIGLQPAGAPGSYLQRFALPAARKFTKTPPEATVSIDGAAAPDLQKLLIPTLASAPGSASGMLVDTGAEGTYDDPRWNDPHRPKIAVGTLPSASESQPTAANPHGFGASIRTLAFSARQKGAVGFLCVVASKDDIRPESGDDRDVGLPVAYVLQKDLPSIMAHGANFTFDAGVEKYERTTQNVLGIVAGSQPDGEVIVVGAHYDHLGWGGSDSLAQGERAIHHGADDNASGTTLMLELARRLSQRSGELPRTLLFAAWGAEEMGLLGSAHWVKDATVNINRVAANLNFDMVGRSRDRKLTIMGSATSTAFEGIADRANAKLAQPLVLSTPAAMTTMGGSSDHQSFLNIKKPAMFFFTGVHSDYHKPTDTAEKIEYQTMSDIADLAESILIDVARLPKIDWANIPTSAPAPAESQGAEKGLRAWLGTVPDYGAEDGGVVLSGTSAGSPAQKAGMKAGDVLTKIGDFQIKDINDLTIALGKLKPGQTLVVEYKRGGELQKLTLTLAARR